MVQVTDELALARNQVSLYYANDIYLAHVPILVFHGPSTTSNSTLNSSRIQIHVFTAAGFQSFPRITISPNSPFYQSVNHLPREKQGDEICRGLAFGLLKYFKELPEVVKSGLILSSANHRSKRPGSAPTLFGEQHAAEIVSSMVRVENIADIISDVEIALRAQSINHVDMDLVLPPGSIAPFQEEEFDENMEDEEAQDPTLNQYGMYASLVKLFGETAFLPTSKLRRAPSKASSINRSRSFLKDQKMSLRREMGELSDTEERYVIKMHELVNHIADDYRAKARDRAFGSFSPSEEDLQKLFPKCLDRILQINSAFLAAIRKVMDETEEIAMQDLEAPVVGSTGSRYGGTGRLKDSTGALAFAKVLLEWFPQFSECYQEYIHASQEFPQIISTFVKQQSSFSQRVQNTGEQRLRSAVIEPVQRLPRYSLFIDNIVNYLPVGHPALQPMLKARDIITSICSLDQPAANKTQVVNRLKNIIEAWPASLSPQGRLITAVDFIELSPPYHIGPPGTPGSRSLKEGIFLLFPDTVVVLRKSGEISMSARGVMAEIDRPSALSMMASATAAAGGQKRVYELSFGGWHVLSDTRFTMSDDGRGVWMASLQELKDHGGGRDRTVPAPTLRAFTLVGAYESKASKFTEEVAKARVEGRFPEKERETDKWSLRSVKLPQSEISLHTAVFEEGIDTLVEGRKEPAPIRVVVDHEKGTKGAPVGHYGVEIVANVSLHGGGLKYRLEVDGLHDRIFVDEVVLEHFLPTFAKRAITLLQSQYHNSNPAYVAPFISFNSKILKSLHVQVDGERIKSSRPASPVKLLSSFLSSGFNNSVSSFKDSGSLSALGRQKGTPTLGNIPSMHPLDVTQAQSNKSTHSVQDFMERKGSVRGGMDDPRPVNPLVRLEETFTGYIAALQSRKGNIVGRVLRNRANADELMINAIYNSFIENPFDQRAASEVSVDILFVAFEKYLRMAWKDQMGQVMSSQTLDGLQDRALKLFPGDFVDYVRMIFGEMAPQNRRAFISIVKLLADLLDGCGNDGDRGALTAAFAELLAIEGNPHDYINLLDRIVEDSEKLFEDIGPGAVNGNPSFGSVSGERSNASATASLTSNTSSLRRRFADTVFRQNSAKEDRPSVWRTLSKTSRNIATGEPIPSSSLSKGPSISRSRSIESPRRPMSRDRPTVLGAFEERPLSSAGEPKRLSAIEASPPPEKKKQSAKTLKKKRRSSLSDLKSLMAAATLRETSPILPSPNRMKGLKLPTSPRTPSPTKIPVVNGERGRSSIYLNGSPTQKESTPLASASRNIGNLTERPGNIMSPSENTPIKELWSPKGHNKTVSLSSNIPTLRGTPRDRAPSVVRPTTSAGRTSPQKLRLQSPQKLRERLQSEAKAISEAEVSLQNELSRIGEEMARLNSGATVRPYDLDTISATVAKLEAKIPEVVKDLTARNDIVKADLEKSLQASEFKVKGLDQLYKESSAENELLYEKFNGELGKIVKALKGKGKDDKEVLVVKSKEQSEEAAKVKKENARLKREVLTLRALLKGNE
ncbi:hypothetical protein BJ875DRAFT_518784 [Amylocarpus encephaloides]|uniref:DH domain-containing protein n=1 Tax=Amylocarpus encephaloides TaxID=45428 RepID=A0A9P8C2B0_9HELO|nr:hypothetical protein BJ875DRAFT_518784 [Amylocarpus encephaloides]